MYEIIKGLFHVSAIGAFTGSIYLLHKRITALENKEKYYYLSKIQELKNNGIHIPQTMDIDTSLSKSSDWDPIAAKWWQMAAYR